MNNRSCQDRRVVSRAIREMAFVAMFITAHGGFLTDAHGQSPTSTRIMGDRLSGFVLPVEPVPGDIVLRSLSASAWTVDDTKRLLLERDVELLVGGQRFTASAAVVWLNRIPSERGLISQFAVYFEDVQSGGQRSGVGVAGRELLVTGSAFGEVTLETSRMTQKRSATPLVRRGESRVEEHLRRVAGGHEPLRQRPAIFPPPSVDTFVPQPGGTLTVEDLLLPTTIDVDAVLADPPWLRHERGMVFFAADRVHIDTGENENVITAIGSIVLDYISPDIKSEWTRLTLTAQRAVIFAEPGTLEQLGEREFTAEQIRGVYLEGHVVINANQDEYIVRAPHVYYDFRYGRAIMLESVLRTYSRSRSKLPIYARAAEMRQLARNQWEVSRARVSVSEFLTPHFGIGAERATITQQPGETPEAPVETFITSEDNTIRVVDVPILYFPRFEGRVEDVPLRSVSVGGSSQDGVSIETRWNLYTLLGRDDPAQYDATLRLDAFTERGVAAGGLFRYDATATGLLDLYAMYDNGTDKTSAGRKVEHHDDIRGVALWEHSQPLGPNWMVQAQTSYISDPTFISARREDDFRIRREYETSGYLAYQKESWAMNALVKYELNDFISNDYLLASRGYQVNRAPEFQLRNYGIPFFTDAIHYSHETRVGYMQFAFEESTPDELGIRRQAFGGPNNTTPVGDLLRARGLNEDWIGRADTRHEWTMPMSAGHVRFVPFVVGRATAYTDDFQSFSSDAESTRWFGSAGVRIATQLQRVYNSVESGLLDLHRLRHVVEPYATFWYGSSSVDQADLPEYDPEVESLADGGAVRLGVRNVLQTQRGGPGLWRSVDVLTLDASLVLTSNDTVIESRTPQWFDYRPEYSQWGDHVHASMIWLLSDSLSLVGDTTYWLNEGSFARGSVGMEMRHSPVLITYIEYRMIEASDNELLDIGWRYLMTPKYLINITPQWDFREQDFRAISVGITRQFPEFAIKLQFRRDEISDETSFSASLDLISF